jgi:hypothetical protein
MSSTRSGNTVVAAVGRRRPRDRDAGRPGNLDQIVEVDRLATGEEAKEMGEGLDALHAG